MHLLGFTEAMFSSRTTLALRRVQRTLLNPRRSRRSPFFPPCFRIASGQHSTCSPRLRRSKYHASPGALKLTPYALELNFNHKDPGWDCMMMNANHPRRALMVLNPGHPVSLCLGSGGHLLGFWVSGSRPEIPRQLLLRGITLPRCFPHYH